METSELLEQVLALVKQLDRAGSAGPVTIPSPSSALHLPPLDLPLVPSFIGKLEKLGLQPEVSRRLQDVFAKHVESSKSSVLEAYRRQGPALLASLSALDECSSTHNRPSAAILADLARGCTQRFLAVVSRLQDQLERRVKAWTSLSATSKATAGFTKAAIETLRRIYVINSYPNPAEVRAIAERISMDYKQVRVWFQNRRNRKTLSARGIQEELRLAQENGVVPSKELAEQARLMAVADLPLPPAKEATTTRKVSTGKETWAATKKPAKPAVVVRRLHENYDWSSSSSEGGMDVDRDEGQCSSRPTALDGLTFSYDSASLLGYGRPPVVRSSCYTSSAGVSPEAQSSSSSLSYSHASSSSLQAPSGSWQPTTSSTRATSPDDQWNLVPIQHDFYAYQTQLDGSLVPPQPQRADSYSSAASSSPSMSDLDSLWSIASLDPSTTYSTFASAPCVPTNLDFVPPPPSDELTLACSDPAFDPPEYLLASTIPAFSSSPTPLAPCERVLDFSSAEGFQAFLDSSSGNGADDDATGGLLWGSGSDVLELTNEIDQVIREFTPEGGTDGGGSFSLFDFNIPPPATEAW